MKKVILGIIAIIAIAVVMMYGGYMEDYIEEEISTPSINPPSGIPFVSETKCLYVVLEQWEKTGENTAKYVGRDRICYPGVIDRHIIYDNTGIAELRIVTRGETFIIKRTYPTKNQPRFTHIDIDDMRYFDTCEECERYIKSKK